KNGTEDRDLCLQRLIRAHQPLFAQRFQVGREACKRLCRESAALLALYHLPEDLRIAQEDRLEQRTVHQRKRCMFEEPSQCCTRGIARKTLLDVFCHRDLFAENECGEERFSRVPVQIERPFPDASFPGDIIDGGLVIAIAQDQGRGRIQNALCARPTPLCGLLVELSSLALLCQTLFSLHASTPLSPDGRRASHEPKRQEGDPGQANGDRQTLEDSGEIDET